MLACQKTEANQLSKFEHLDEALDLSQLILLSGEHADKAAEIFYKVGNSTGLLKLVRNSEQSYNTSKLEKPREPHFATNCVCTMSI